jgi:hypothetical protein
MGSGAVGPVVLQRLRAGLGSARSGRLLYSAAVRADGDPQIKPQSVDWIDP